MSNWSIWGSEIKNLRKKADMTQGKLIDQFSLLVSQLTEQEHENLASIHLVQEVTTYFGGILDTPTLSKLERGKRILSSRKRVLAFIWGFKKIGMLTTIEEAEQLLQLSGYGGRLTDGESAVLFNISPITHPVSYPKISELKKESLSVDASKPTHEITPTTKQSSRNLLPFVAGLLIIFCVGGGLYWQFFGRDQDASAALTEDFSESFDATLWDMEDAPHSSLQNERLLFDSPVNDDQEWLSENVYYLGKRDILSRIKFEISVDTPETYVSGSLGLLTTCSNNMGWMNIYAGQSPPRLFVEYATKDEIDDWEEDVTFVDIMNIERGQLYVVDLRWLDDSLHISVEGNEAEPLIIPCDWTSYFHIHTSLSRGEKIRGFVDQLRVWH